MIGRLLLTFCLFFATVTTALGRDIVVDNLGGDDRNNGETLTAQGKSNGPCKTITKALRLVKSGDRIIIIAHPGEPYRERIAVQSGFSSGRPGAPAEIIGNGAVLDGTMSLIASEWDYEGNDVFSIRPRLMAHQQLFLGDKAAKRVQVNDGVRPKLEPREWCLFEGKIYLRCEAGRIPASYNPACCGLQTGITLYEVHDLVISNLTVRGFQLDGVNAHDTARRIDLVNVTSVDNGRSGFSIGGASRVRLDDCNAAGNGKAQVRTEGYSITQILGGKLDETTAPAVVSDGGKVIRE
ncbi:MAG: right-handed parallel beta-helix repeat-containing protein [Planctomycetales bacterium]|nr:right-handed parallel beta-helix repeat-containing protein [Planctomycetales bacterium]